jgi:hypothetical protein
MTLVFGYCGQPVNFFYLKNQWELHPPGVSSIMAIQSHFHFECKKCWLTKPKKFHQQKQKNIFLFLKKMRF